MRRKIRRFFAMVLTTVLIVTSLGSGVVAQGISSESKKGRQVPHNPLHSCNITTGSVSQSTTPGYFNPTETVGPIKEDVGLWDYVYFGNYPQSEVTDYELIAKIERVISENSISQNEISGEPGLDAVVEGIKYRRIAKEDRNHKEYEGNTFGNVRYRYFQWEPIKWKVLQNDEQSLLLLADKGMDCKNYHEKEANVTWETSDLRKWLNGNFYSLAFDENEQNAIIEQTLVNEKNGFENTHGGRDTLDKVYLLSLSDVSNKAYGYCGNPLAGSASRWQLPTDYTVARGAYTYGSNLTDGKKNCWWWLRTPGESQKKVVYIGNDGDTATIGNWCENSTTSVCPVIKIDVLSQEWKQAGDGSNGEGKILTNLSVTIMREEYSSSETIPVKDLKVTATYFFCSKNYEVQLSEEDFETNIAELDMSTPGEKIVTVTYTDRGVTKTADVSVQVMKSSSGGSSTEPGSGSGTETPDQPGSGSETETPGQPGGGSTTETPGQPGSGSTTEMPDQPGGGSTTETPTQPGIDNGNSQNADDNANKTVKVTKMKISGPSNKLAAGKKVNLSLEIFPANVLNQEVKWSTSNKKYATVDQTGRVSLKAKGAGKKVTITAEAKDGSGVKASYKITIMKHAVKSIKIKAASKTLRPGSSMKLKTVVKTSGKNANTTLKWTSSNSKYATVSKTGKVKAKKAGKGKTVTITAVSTDGSNKKAKIKMKIK